VVIVETRAFTARIGELEAGIPMRQDLFEELLESVKEGGAILRGESAPSRIFYIEEPDIRSLREKHALSQLQFAALMGISVGTLRNWEQGRRKPEGSARVLLRVVESHPDAVFEVVEGMTRSSKGSSPRPPSGKQRIVVHRAARTRS